MKILIDLQGAQTLGSRHRGIGRYSLSLTKAILQNYSKEHDILVLLSGAFGEAVLEIKEELKNYILDENIKVWYPLKNIAYSIIANSTKKIYSECLREEFIKTINPDLLLNTSLIEGFIDDSVISIDKNTEYITATILYDLIPYIHQKNYLSDAMVKEWYYKRIEALKKSDILLSISNSSREEGIKYLNIKAQDIINISSASDSFFTQIQIPKKDETDIRAKYKIDRDFIMYTGGLDFRKNIENLIIAYANLPQDIQKSHQLAIVCSIQEADREKLNSLAKSHHIADGNIVFTGYVTDRELLLFYNLCKLFVFPSWHEGFGLPVLEAMSCKKAVIGANATSIPEVIGLQEALFDPFDINSITEKIQRVISDDDFREKLQNHSIEYAKNFSWNQTAKTAMQAIERAYKDKIQIKQTNLKKPKLAYLSPLPPQKSGISDYSFELLPELLAHYDIDLITDEENIALLDSLELCTLHPIEYFKENYYSYDRVLYHIGNSQFHKHMFILLKEYAGTIVLHDFFVSNIVAHIETTHYKLNFLNEALYNSHGYIAIKERFDAKDIDEFLWKYPTNLDILKNSNGIIMHSLRSKELFSEYYDQRDIKNLEIIPLLRVQAQQRDKHSIKKMLNLQEDSFIICSFGTLGETKLNHEIISAFINSSLTQNCYLIFVGECSNKLYLKKLQTLSENFASKIIFSGWIDKERYQDYLSISDMAIQLRTLWRGETSAAALDCMNYAIATIVNANGSMAELPEDSVLMIKDDFKTQDLTDAMELLKKDDSLRQTISKNAAALIKSKHNPKYCADLYFNAIEKFYKNHPPMQKTIEKLTKLDNLADDETLYETAIALSLNHPRQPSLKQLFVDISVLVAVDASSGIQRVVKNILNYLLHNQPKGFKVEPVYAANGTYFYAREYTLAFMSSPANILTDDVIEPQNGDIFIGLDLAPMQTKANKSYLDFLMALGVDIKFVLYDLLPITAPSFFTPQDRENFQEWLELIINYSGVIAISNSVADELKEYMLLNHKSNMKNFTIDYFHLGADFKKPSESASQDFTSRLKNRVTFLMVGTIEPRKGHSEVLDAFEELFDEEINLVIVGKEGWLVQELIKKIKTHKELDNKLFFLPSASDEELEELYKKSSALIAASYAEGFGLPLIEAAQHKLPIIARDIAVFREVAGKNALYFKEHNLKESIKEWLKLYKQNAHPLSDNLSYLSWHQSAKDFTELILKQETK